MSGNTTSLNGGGIENWRSLELVASSVTDNTAANEGGGIRNSGGTATLVGGSSVTGKTPNDCVGTPTCS